MYKYEIKNDKVMDTVRLNNSVSSSVSSLQGSYSIQLDITGSPVGTLELQASNDQNVYSTMSTQTVNGTLNRLYYIYHPAYKFMKLVYTYTSGDGYITAYVRTLKD